MKIFSPLQISADDWASMDTKGCEGTITVLLQLDLFCLDLSLVKHSRRRNLVERVIFMTRLSTKVFIFQSLIKKIILLANLLSLKTNVNITFMLFFTSDLHV